MAGPGDARLERLARRVAARLLAAEERLATAESCTGGWVAKCLTDIAGSSDWFERGWVCYSNAAKSADLRVGTRLLARHGAVSRPVALAMASGALARARADVAVAVTGIAGPAGGTRGKPVGTVWIAWARRGRRPVALRFRFAGGREAVRRRTVAAALAGLLER